MRDVGRMGKRVWRVRKRHEMTDPALYADPERSSQSLTRSQYHQRHCGGLKGGALGRRVEMQLTTIRSCGLRLGC